MHTEAPRYDIDACSFPESCSRIFSFWASGEEGRIIASRDLSNITDSRRRLREAANDFETCRVWPTATWEGLGPRFLWHMFAYFIGVTSKCEWPADFGSDDDGEEEGAPQGQWLHELPYWDSKEDRRVDLFLNHTSSIVRLFLSSYSRRAGFIWSTINLDCIAPVLEFFVKYILRRKICPANESSLRSSICVIDCAKKELPNIAVISKRLPDDLSHGCYVRLGWGTPEHPGLPLATEVPDRISVNKDARRITEDEAQGVEDTSFWETSYRNLCARSDCIVLQLTFMPGIVEQSMRRIKRMIPPTCEFPPLSFQNIGISANAVNSLLSSYVQLIMEPAPVSWDRGELPVYTLPTILKPLPRGNQSTDRAHNPFCDDLTLLVEPGTEVLSLLALGMGLGGTWVQLIPKEASFGEGRSVWYIHNLSIITPSFWAVDL
ncbi:hypothetical protein CVT26_005503 [Gymnopilus dilepis]|uniref:Uncharacterized protein n=1 Tax=Gymnopilus dilepis TaxID=231916 RepID=A0A409WJH0_9AGAR|nr:hypothetical protein CVT26_005503 [Gymnopilus dilepis]